MHHRLMISIHAPQWGATRTLGRLLFRGVFQSTHPSGVRQAITSYTTVVRAHFNPRTPVGCDSTVGSRPYPSGHFNPRTPVGCDYLRRLMRAPHRDFNPRTPVGCDLLHDMDCGHDVRISIHAPQWGATVDIEGGRNRQPISIHAPQWGATRFPPCPTRNPEYFNPRTPVGCDSHVNLIRIAADLFQSTHPSGVRRQHEP